MTQLCSIKISMCSVHTGRTVFSPTAASGCLMGYVCLFPNRSEAWNKTLIWPFISAKGKKYKKEYGDLIIPIVFSLRNKNKAWATRTNSVRRGGHPSCELGHARMFKVFLLASLYVQTLPLLGMFLLITKTHAGSLIYHGLSSQVSSCWSDWREGRCLAAGEDCPLLGDAEVSFEGDEEALFLIDSCNCLLLSPVPCWARYEGQINELQRQLCF